MHEHREPGPAAGWGFCSDHPDQEFCGGDDFDWRNHLDLDKFRAYRLPEELCEDKV